MAPAAPPPFRADQVGSLLRPAALQAARQKHERGEIGAGELRAIEDACIGAAIRRQEEAGLRAVTDGEMRRTFWHFDFIGGFAGVELKQEGRPIYFHGRESKPYSLRVVDKIDYDRPIMIDDFAFVAANTRLLPKQTIPSPSVLHFRGGRRGIDSAVYPDLGEFFDDLGRAFAKAIRAFYEAGCRYLQIDETNLAYLCDPAQLQALRERGEDADSLLATYAALINKALAGRPPDLTVSLHLCRGNFRSTGIASGGYEPVAEVLFNAIAVDSYFLEYDDERSGGFAPLRLLPKGKTAVLGLVTSKRGALEAKDAVRRRIEEAAAFAPIEQLALSPQCGFASTVEGNELNEAEQWRKLALCVEVAREVWGAV
jgi:5-methyltetrahydropteroyltriglutamate--homocysteine methyltransferase